MSAADPDNRQDPDKRRDQLAWEARWRPRASRASVAAGFLLLGSALIEQFVVFANYPSVGLIQGLTPALNGQRDYAVGGAPNPRIQVIQFLDHHAFGTIVWGTLGGLGTALLAVVLTFMYRATRFRRPELTSAARSLAIAGPIAVGLLSIVRLVALTITAHHFLTSSDHSRHAIDSTLAPGVLVVVGYLAFAASLAMGFAFVVIALNAMRVGLLTRFMGVLGIFVGILEVIPQLASPLPVIQTLWLVSLGVLIAGGWPTGTPPAWEAGEARPWPSNQQLREARQAARDAGSDDDEPETGSSDDPAPAPVPAHSSSKKRKRKRRA
jgi:hypothetical protein